MNKSTITLVLGAIIAVVVQLIVAPNLAIANAIPNFILAYILVIAVMRPTGVSMCALAFVMGLCFDLLGHGPIGAMSFLLVLTSYIVSLAFVVLDKSNLLATLMVLVIAAVSIELLYGVFLLLTGVIEGVFEMIIYRAIPCAIYSSIVTVLVYLATSRLLSDEDFSKAAPKNPASVQLRSADQNGVRLSKKKNRGW